MSCPPRKRASPWAVELPLGLVLCGLLAGGCFDAREVDDSGIALVWSTARLVDDAERSDGRPSWNLLGPWNCGSWPEHQATCRTIEPGVDDHGHARALDFDVEPKPGPDDADQDPAHVSTGAILFTHGITDLDLSVYDTLVFSAKVEPDPAYPQDLYVGIQLHCPDVAPIPVNPEDGAPSLQSAVTPVAGADWQTFGLRIADFIQPGWEVIHGLAIDPLRCLHRVRDIGVDITPSGPGLRLAGTLLVDDLELGTRHRVRARTLPNLSLSPFYCYTPGDVVDPSCDAPPSDLVVTLAEGSNDGALVGQARCADVEALDDSSVLRQAELDMSEFDELSVEATFLPSNPADRHPGTFSVRLGCNDGSVVRSFAVSSGLASHKLALSSFKRDGPHTRSDCLAHVDSVCVETGPTDGAVPGTLSVAELGLR